MELPWDQMKSCALLAFENAYAPYSGFHVGAAIFSEGEIFFGCNVENASYPVGMCAERVALGGMVCKGKKKIDALYLAANPLITPCGMCRQALSEFSNDFPVRFYSVLEKKELETSFLALFPSAFELNKKV